MQCNGTILKVKINTSLKFSAYNLSAVLSDSFPGHLKKEEKRLESSLLQTQNQSADKLPLCTQLTRQRRPVKNIQTAYTSGVAYTTALTLKTKLIRISNFWQKFEIGNSNILICPSTIHMWDQEHSLSSLLCQPLPPITCRQPLH